MLFVYGKLPALFLAQSFLLQLPTRPAGTAGQGNTLTSGSSASKPASTSTLAKTDWPLHVCTLHSFTCVSPCLQNALAPADPRLDFFSEHFDAVRALHTKGLQPPVPRVKPLDNVVKCRLILPPELPDSWSAWNAAHPKTEPSEVRHSSCSWMLYDACFGVSVECCHLVFLHAAPEPESSTRSNHCAISIVTVFFHIELSCCGEPCCRYDIEGDKSNLWTYLTF